MNASPLLTDEEVAALLAGQPITHRGPWAGGEDAVDAWLAQACTAIEDATGANSRITWDHYGSGYASFVDAWFYLPQSGLRAHKEQAHTGLVVLLSRLAPYFVFMEGSKSWHAQGGSSYLPEFDMIDRLASDTVIRMAELAQHVLERRGLQRASGTALAVPLAEGLAAPTVLSAPPYRQFDALFHWED